MTIFEVRVPVATVWTGPEAPRDVDAPAVLDDPDVAAWAKAMDQEVRRGLVGRTLTQLLLGEGVQVLDEDGEADRSGGPWVRVAALSQPSAGHAHGYPGWVRRAHLAEPVARFDGATAFVTEPTAMLTGVGEISAGTALWVDPADAGTDAVGVLLPGGGTGTLERSAVRLSDRAAEPSFTGEDLLAFARRFLGLRYLWGGTSAWGLDCSGLVHLTLRAHGVVVPRDACDQAETLAPVALDSVRPGDLYFFARPGERVYHVGFVSRPVAADGTRWMLHAPEGGELIEDAPMAPHRVETLVGAARVTR